MQTPISSALSMSFRNLRVDEATPDAAFAWSISSIPRSGKNVEALGCWKTKGKLLNRSSVGQSVSCSLERENHRRCKSGM